MKILNFGSLNYDKVYHVDHFARAGETLSAREHHEFLGGKGLNQSVALARAGATVYHAGAVGADGGPLRAQLEDAGVDTGCLAALDTVSGHAVIQLCGGQNCIIVYGGANQRVTPEYLDAVLARFGAGDLLLVQNETACVAHAMRAAKARGMQIAFNASPITPELFDYPLELVDYFLLNEIEGLALAGPGPADFAAILDRLAARYQGAIILTVGAAGAYYRKGGQTCHAGIYDVPVVDTTGAGDTFCGFFLAAVAKGVSPAQALRTASAASSLAVSREGAANSIPTWREVQAFLFERA